MRSELIHTHLSCNQNCRYCTVRRPADDPTFIATGAVRGRIDAVIAAGGREVVLSGGEPAMRADLALLVAHAVARGASRVTLETNATLVDRPRAEALARAGLGIARVNLSGWGSGLDAVTRDPGGFERARAGLLSLLEAGVDVEVAVALTRSTLPLLAGLPAGLAELARHSGPRRAAAAGASIEAHGLLGLVARVPVTSPEPAELLDYPEAAAALVALAAASRAEGLSLRLSPDSGPPPCVMPTGVQAAHLYSLTPGSSQRANHRHLDPCGRCQVADRCSGLDERYLERHDAPPMRPVGDDRFRRRLSLIGSVQEQVRREFVMVDRVEQPGQPVSLAHLIRVNFHCNQSCRFCFVSTHLPAPGDEAVRRAIHEAVDGGFKVVLTGGEPTLNPRLVEYVRLARSLSPHPIHLQTNATRLGDAAAVGALVEAGLSEVFVSLHGSTAAVSDAITEAPGTFERTVAGVDRLAEAGLLVILNFVISARNQDDIAAWVRLCAARWPQALLNVSFVAPSSDVVPRDEGLIPRYRDVLPELARAVEEARRLSMKLTGFESMCGIPLCLVPTELAPYFALSDKPAGFDGGEFIKTETCRACSLERKCHGVRRGYVELYGPDELRAIAAPAAS